jgi:hypothetical protein
MPGITLSQFKKAMPSYTDFYAMQIPKRQQHDIKDLLQLPIQGFYLTSMPVASI